MIPLGDLKTAVRANVFPTGEAENLVAAHDKMFVDCLIDLQTVVDCLQQDNTDIFPQCSTFYQCQTTVLPCPRGSIVSVSVIDKIDPTTHTETLTAADDYCARIYYREIDPCHFRAWINRGGLRGCGCVALPLFFGLPCDLWGSGSFPFPPTDAGVPSGLPPLPMGFHYPQTSTDRVSGTNRWRARAGVWCKERGKIYIAPWIQSTETVIVVWDGIKRSWTDADMMDDDPLLSQAIEEYVRWRHADKYDHDAEEAARAGGAYALAKQALVHQCREETRQRACEPSRARSSVGSLTTLFYNTDQVASGACPDGSNPVSVTIPAGSVSSSVSVADANSRALTQAQQQVQSRLAQLCTPEVQGFANDAQTATVSCQGEEGAPTPEGAPVTVTIPAGTITSTISKLDANNQALALAQQQASAQLRCTYWNKAETVSLRCATDDTIVATATVAAHTFSSTVSQSDADQQAVSKATDDANTQLAGSCPSTTVYHNTPQSFSVAYQCRAGIYPVSRVIINIIVPANIFSGLTQAEANNLAIYRGNQYATGLALQYCNAGQYGTYQVVYPYGP